MPGPVKDRWSPKASPLAGRLSCRSCGLIALTGTLLECIGSLTALVSISVGLLSSEDFKSCTHESPPHLTSGRPKRFFSQRSEHSYFKIRSCTVRSDLKNKHEISRKCLIFKIRSYSARSDLKNKSARFSGLLSVNSPASILSKNSGISLAKIGLKSANKSAGVG